MVRETRCASTTTFELSAPGYLVKSSESLRSRVLHSAALNFNLGWAPKDTCGSSEDEKSAESSPGVARSLSFDFSRISRWEAPRYTRSVLNHTVCLIAAGLSSKANAIPVV